MSVRGPVLLRTQGAARASGGAPPWAPPLALRRCRPPLPFFDCGALSATSWVLIATHTEEHLTNTGVADPAEARRWTREMDGFLTRMHARGKSFGWIGRALGLPREACAARAVALGLVLRRRAPRTCPPDAPEPKPIGAMNDVLDAGVCHWVAGCLSARVWRMCGHPSVHGTLWCAHHLGRVRAARRHET